ncbi:MAG: hypothetical protein L6R43_01685 [Planctomycetes bacterium]|nr:hypothetical protein [Planctomycetota bacterium]
MRTLRPLRPLLPAAAAAALLLVPAGAAVRTSGWPDAPGDGLRAAVLGAGEAAADLSLEPGRRNDLFLAWTEGPGSLLRVQRLTDAGAPAYGASGAVVRAGGGLGIAGTRPAGDARGPFELLPATDGGVLVAWTEASETGRALRVQRLGSAGETLFAAGGVPLLDGLGPDGGDAAVCGDGSDGAAAAGVIGEDGKGFARVNRVGPQGTTVWPVPGLALDAAPDPKSGPSVAAFPGGETAVCWRRDDGAGLRFQVVDSTGFRLPAGGVALGPSSDGAPGMRSAGSFLPGSMLVAHRFSGTVLVKLVGFDGAVVRDEAAGSTTLAGPPLVTAVNAQIGGLPEGIEVKGVRTDGTAVRFVRDLTGAWRAVETLSPPGGVPEGVPGALGGPGWFFDLGASDLSPAGLAAGYRFGVPETGTLDPSLGPWLALAPGATGFLRCAVGGPWVWSAWVDGSGSADAVVAARSGAFGGQDVLDARGLLLRKATVTRPAAGSGTVNAQAPEAALPGTRDPETGRTALPSEFRLRIGSERGTTASLSLASWKGSKSLSWKAAVSGPGGMAGTVSAGPSGRGIRVKVKGIPTDPAERVLWIRVDLDDRSQAATVLLAPKGRTGAKGIFRGP